MLKKQNQEISARMESFNDGLLDSLNRTNTNFRDATLQIEAIAMQLRRAFKNSSKPDTPPAPPSQE